MNTQHTPGPWTSLPAYTNRNAIPIGKQRRDEVAITHDVFAETYGANYEANAKLIAAAPELLEALIKCKQAVENKDLPPSARMELVRDYTTPAITKATKQD